MTCQKGWEHVIDQSVLAQLFTADLSFCAGASGVFINDLLPLTPVRIRVEDGLALRASLQFFYLIREQLSMLIDRYFSGRDRTGWSKIFAHYPNGRAGASRRSAEGKEDTAGCGADLINGAGQVRRLKV